MADADQEGKDRTMSQSLTIDQDNSESKDIEESKDSALTLQSSSQFEESKSQQAVCDD